MSDTTGGKFDVAIRVKSLISVIDALSPTQKHVLEISGEPCAHTALLRGCVHTDEDEVGLFDTLIDIGREEKVASACLTDNVFEAWLIDGQVELGTVPGINTSLVQVDDGHSDMRALQRDNRASWATFWVLVSIALYYLDILQKLTDITSTNCEISGLDKAEYGYRDELYLLQQIFVTFTGAISVFCGWTDCGGGVKKRQLAVGIGRKARVIKGEYKLRRNFYCG